MKRGQRAAIDTPATAGLGLALAYADLLFAGCAVLFAGCAVLLAAALAVSVGLAGG